jgi:type IV secretion system coupling TraD/TrwB family protein/type IV secretory system conjugative DNA transfer VirD4/TraG family protein
MPSAHEVLSEQFHRWEERGRGWQVFECPVAPEPPFVPFQYVPPEPPIDDGRRPTFLSSLIQGLSSKLVSAEPPLLPEPEPEPEPTLSERGSLVELRLSLPPDHDPESFEPFLHSVSLCREPLSFELLGLSKGIITQLAVGETDATRVRKQMEGNFPEVAVQPETGVLESAWTASGEGEAAIVEFGLEREFMLTLNTGRFDAFVGIAAALAELEEGELGLFQILFASVHEPWRDSILRAVTHADGKPLFVNSPELAKQAAEKISRPLYAAVVRIATRAADFDRAWEIARDMASSLRVFASPTGNELIPLRNDEYPFENHVEDVLSRQSRRSGMLLNVEELLGFVHLPSSDVPNLTRAITKTKAAPASGDGLLLGENVHRGRIREVRVSADQRVRHMHIIGASGTGKSTLLFNLIRQDIENGDGVALLDPHGDLVDKLLGIIPRDRVEDVILIDPSDEEYSVGFNILSAHSELEKNLMASDLVSVFQRLSTSWGDQMASVLNNTIRAFLESSRGGTLADLRRFLLEPEFRNEYLATVSDPEITYYWRKAFPQLAGNKSVGPVVTRLQTFLDRKQISHMVSQKENRLDFGSIMDSGKIFLAKLSQGLIGKENSWLLGSLLVSKFQQTAMSRQAQVVRRDFWFYADEFQNFMTPSMAEILSGARKYRLGLILAHQELRQLERDREVASAVFNCCTRVVFRVGDDDARKLSEGFAFFEARDLQNLEVGQAIGRIERSDHDFNLSVPFPEDGDSDEAAMLRTEIIAASRKKYGTPRAEIELALRGSQEQPAKQDNVGGPSDSLHPRRRQPPPTPAAPPVVTEPISVPKPTEVQKTSEVPKPIEPASTPVRTDLGKGIGGHQHNLVRERIEAAAKPLGFYVARERLVQDGGKIDLALERPGQFIGCEISFETTIDHEVGNVAKCLKAGCHHVAVICSSENRLAKIRQGVTSSFAGSEASRVGYYLPEQFLARLPELAPQQTADTTPEAVRLGKYTLKRHGPSLTPEERLAREEAALRLIAESMKRKR